MNSDSTMTEIQSEGGQSLFVNPSVNPSDLPHVEAISYTPIDSKYKWVMHSLSVLIGIAATVLVGIILNNVEGVEIPLPWGIAAGVGGLLFVVRSIFVEMAFKWKGYALRKRDVIYRSGLIYRKVIVIPFARIQHGELSEGVIDRLLGLRKLKLYTAGGSSSDLSIPGLPREVAEQMRSHIMNRVIEESEESKIAQADSDEL